MPYTTNPHLPRVRMQAVLLLRKGWSTRKVAKHFGFNQSTIVRWNKRASDDGRNTIPTLSSRPTTHPRKLDWHVVQRIIQLRIKTNGRCSEVIHKMLSNEGIRISLRSVKRTLLRNGLTRKRSPWKKYHLSGERPKAIQPGDLVEVDTIHLMKDEKRRIYIYTLIDVYSRWAYAYATKKLRAGASIGFVQMAQKKFAINFKCLQSDHGPEFSKYFTNMVGTRHRHSRVRKPNDNAHLERFNRTIQHEFLRYLPVDVDIINRHLDTYLEYYNQERLHLGLNLKTPMEVMRSYCP